MTKIFKIGCGHFLPILFSLTNSLNCWQQRVFNISLSDSRQKTGSLPLWIFNKLIF
jgi:hypothetical protein